MATDLPARQQAKPAVASADRLTAAVSLPERLAALVAEGLLDNGPQPIFDRFARVAASAAGAPVAVVSFVTDTRQVFAGMLGVGQPYADARETPLSHSFCQHVVANAAPLVVEDARIDPVLCSNLAISDLDVVAYAGFPIVDVDGHVLGSVCAIDPVPRVWDPSQLDALSDVAVLVGTELERRSMGRRLASDARTDALTELPNRRAWDERLPLELRQAEGLRHALTAVIVDIDNFKDHNDRHGHPAGDAVLRAIGSRWREHVRDIDLLARIGGEEFGLLLPGCTAPEALAIVERLRRDMPAGLTASAGVATWAAPMSAAELVTAADRELYRAKAEGRDRTCAAAAPVALGA